jgi:hypothetical protein
MYHDSASSVFSYCTFKSSNFFSSFSFSPVNPVNILFRFSISVSYAHVVLSSIYHDNSFSVSDIFFSIVFKLVSIFSFSVVSVSIFLFSSSISVLYAHCSLNISYCHINASAPSICSLISSILAVYSSMSVSNSLIFDATVQLTVSVASKSQL